MTRQVSRAIPGAPTQEVISLEAYKAAAQENAEFLACLGITSWTQRPSELLRPQAYRRTLSAQETQAVGGLRAGGALRCGSDVAGAYGRWAHGAARAS